MKKVLVILLVSAFVSAFAFADGITFGAWGRAGYIIGSGSTTGPADLTGASPAWANGARVGFNIHGSSANVGFDLNVDSNGNAIGIGDNARIWIKVADFLRFDIGKAQTDALRGKIGNDWADSLPGYVFNELGDEDATFTRFYTGNAANGSGLTVSLTPVEGLFIGAALDSNALTPPTVAQSFAGIQAGAGYTIKDIGQVRVQYIGNKDFGAGTSTLEAAFALMAVKGLTIDLGTKIPVHNGAGVKSTVQLNTALSLDALSLTLKLKTAIGTSIGFGAYLDGNYTIAGPFAAGAKVSFDGFTQNANSLAFLPYVKFGYSNGFIGLGFMYKLDLSTVVAPAVANNQWSIPVFAEYWF